MVICMKKGENKEEREFQKVDKITKIITIIICVVLGTIFLAACIYMLDLIAENQSVASNNSNNVPQNVNLVNI